MILDTLENSHRYRDLCPGFDKAFDFLVREDIAQLPVDRYELDGERVYAMVAKDPGRKPEDAQLETHRNYIDIQLVLDGVDSMGWKPAQLLSEPVAEYDAKRDLQFFNDRPDSWAVTKPGTFAMFFPEDAHMPLIGEGVLHKVIAKVAV